MDYLPSVGREVKWLQLVLALAQQVPLKYFGPIQQPRALSGPLRSTGTGDLFHVLQIKLSSDPERLPVSSTDILQLQTHTPNAQGGCP